MHPCPCLMLRWCFLAVVPMIYLNGHGTGWLDDEGSDKPMVSMVSDVGKIIERQRTQFYVRGPDIGSFLTRSDGAVRVPPDVGAVVLHDVDADEVRVQGNMLGHGALAFG